MWKCSTPPARAATGPFECRERNGAPEGAPPLPRPVPLVYRIDDLVLERLLLGRPHFPRNHVVRNRNEGATPGVGT